MKTVLRKNSIEYRVCAKKENRKEKFKIVSSIEKNSIEYIVSSIESKQKQEKTVLSI